jgi:four helix bundle protein
MVTSGSFIGVRVAGASAGVNGEPAVASRPLTPAPAPAQGKGMNDPEVTMLDAAPNTGLTVLRRALEAAGLAMRLAARVPAPFRPLADQVIRSASSVPANLAEGHGRSGRDRLHHWRIAYGSAKEVDSHLRLLVHARAVDVAQATAALQLFDEVRAMAWRLLHPKP